MTDLVVNLRELSLEEIDQVTGGPGPVGAAVGAVIGGVAGAGSAAAQGGDAGAIIGGAVGGALIGGAVGFFTPGNSARLLLNGIRSGQAGLLAGMVAGAVDRAFDD